MLKTVGVRMESYPNECAAADLGNAVLLLGRHLSVPEEKSAVLSGTSLDTLAYRRREGTHLVQRLLNLLEVPLRQVPRIDSLDFSSKILELGSIRGGRERQGKELNSHRAVSGSGSEGSESR